MFQPGLRPEISQGDVFETLHAREVIGGKDEDYVGSAVLLSHDCEFDKPDHAYTLVARVIPIIGAPEPRWDAIRRGRTLNAIHLPAVGTAVESFIDLRYIHRLPKDDLRAAVAANGRVASMTDDGRAAIIAYLYRFFTRTFPR